MVTIKHGANYAFSSVSIFYSYAKADNIITSTFVVKVKEI
jgi:hypothetical protein